jgi:hypothetical protein
MAAKNILLVEGKDDQHVLVHLSSNRGGPRFDEVLPHEGDTKLLDAIPVRLKAAGDEAIVGIVMDADTDLDARWQSLRDRLVKLGYAVVPASPVADGTIVERPEGEFLPRVGIWIMPDNQTRGILEDFLQFLVPTGSKLFGHEKTSVATIPEGERRFSQLAEPKALIHAWLAWQEEPGKAMGTAITARYLDPNVAQVDVLVSWLNRLFLP